MSNVKFNRKLLEKEIGKLDEKMQERIALFGTPVESLNDEEIELEIFPNRPDLLSYHGFLRGFKAFLGKDIGLKNYKVEKPEKDFYVVVDKSVADVRPFTVCAIVKGMKFDDNKIKEIIDIQEKLHFSVGRKRKKIAIGIYPLEKIRFPIAFKALEPDKIKFKPLGMNEEMTGFQILQRHPTGREYAHLLSNKEKFPLFVDADDHILSMPPIINSDSTGKIEETTKNVFIECSGFDFRILSKCLNIIVTAMADMGGKIYGVEVRYKSKEITPNLNAEECKLDIKNANKTLGLDLNEKQIKTFLERMGHDYEHGKVSVAAWRTDVLHEVDLIEDIAIAYGYDNFIPVIPEISSIGKEDKREVIKRKIAEILSGKEFLEMSNYHLTTKEDQFLNFGLKPKNMMEVRDAKTNFNILRQDLSHYIMKVFSENSDAEYPQRVFETGIVFGSDFKERENLAIGMAPGNFTELRQVLEYLMSMFGLEIKIVSSENCPEYFIDGRAGKIIINGKDSGFIGEVHPRILKNWKIKMPVTLLEIDLEEVYKRLI